MDSDFKYTLKVVFCQKNCETHFVCKSIAWYGLLYLSCKSYRNVISSTVN